MRKPKLSGKLPKNTEEQLVGKEPKDCVLDKIGTLFAYNHFNYFYNTDKSIEFFERYLEKVNKELIKKFRKYPPNQFPNNIGWISKMKMSNVTLTKETEEYFQKFLDKLEAFEIPIKVTNPLKKVVNYENQYIINLEHEHDKLVKNLLKNKFNADEYFKVNVPTSADIKKINEYYTPILEELKSISTDAKVREGYASYSKKEILALITFYTDILNNVKDIKVEKTRTRAPRKPKPVSVQKKIKRLRFLEKDNTLNVSSISPDKVLTSSCILLYNRVKRKLYLFEANGTFDVSGVSITNLNPEKSFQKTIRKPETVKDLLAGSKASIIKKFNEVKTVAAPVEKFGTNVETLLLRAFV